MKSLLPGAIAGAVVALVVVFWLGPGAAGRNTADSQPAFERVTRTRTLRCGYVFYPPYFMRDPNTGKLSGIFYELMEAAAQAMSLKTEYVAEASFATVCEDLKQGRYDVCASAFWPCAASALSCECTIPISYVLVNPYVRADDRRFDGNLTAVNSEGVRIATMDGEMTAIIAKTDFPGAQEVAVPHNSDFSMLCQNVVSGKADITFLEPSMVRRWLAGHADTLRNPTPGKPLRVFGNSMALAKGEMKLLTALNATLQELLQNGVYEKIEARYAKSGDFYPVARPYQSAD